MSFYNRKNQYLLGTVSVQRELIIQTKYIPKVEDSVKKVTINGTRKKLCKKR